MIDQMMNLKNMDPIMKYEESLLVKKIQRIIEEGRAQKLALIPCQNIENMHKHTTIYL